MRKSLVKSKDEIAIIVESGKILSLVLKELKENTKTGISLKELDKLAFDFITKLNAKPAFLGYKPDGAEHPYPASICASVNNVVVHGIPTDYRIKDTDIVKVDVGVRLKGYCTDAAFTLCMPKAPSKTRELVLVTERALQEAISVARAGNRLGDIGYAVGSCVESAGFSVVKSLTGHGIGTKLHEDPYVYNFGSPGTGLELLPGMVLALEPITALGSGAIKQAPDESYVTKDNSPSAHFEHTIIITEGEPLVVTA